MRTDILTLISQAVSTDEYGDYVSTETQKTVFCEVVSVGQKEFYQAQAVGLQPEIKFIIADYLDYSGERYVEYSGQRYKVLRTYRNGTRLELVCYKEVNSSIAPAEETDNGDPEISS